MTMAPTRPTFTVQRAESEYQRKAREAKAADDKAAIVRAEQHARSERQAQEAQRALSSPHSSLRLALDWYRKEWRASYPWQLHDHDEEHQEGDVLGAAAWTEWWKTWLSEADPDEPTARPRDPLRAAHHQLRASGSMFDRAGAEFLFRLACMDFDVEATALTMEPPLAHVYMAWYTEKAIDRLREKVGDVRRRPAPTVSRPEWMDRLHIGKSEAQANAEDVA